MTSGGGHSDSIQPCPGCGRAVYVDAYQRIGDHSALLLHVRSDGPRLCPLSGEHFTDHVPASALQLPLTDTDYTPTGNAGTLADDSPRATPGAVEDPHGAGVTLPERWALSGQPAYSDNDNAILWAWEHGSGRRATLTIRELAVDGTVATAAAILIGDYERRLLIRALGGIPLDESRRN